MPTSMCDAIEISSIIGYTMLINRNTNWTYNTAIHNDYQQTSIFQKLVRSRMQSLSNTISASITQRALYIVDIKPYTWTSWSNLLSCLRLVSLVRLFDKCPSASSYRFIDTHNFFYCEFNSWPLDELMAPGMARTYIFLKDFFCRNGASDHASWAS